MNHEMYMKKAYDQAILAGNLNEVPVGCVITYNGKVIGRGFNKRNYMKNPLYHAEIEAINEAAKFMGDWRLEKSTLYVTIEPCSMCAGAIVQSRIPILVYGADNKKAGSCGSILNIVENTNLNHKVKVIKGIMEKECSFIMKQYFKDLRSKYRQ